MAESERDKLARWWNILNGWEWPEDLELFPVNGIMDDEGKPKKEAIYGAMSVLNALGIQPYALKVWRDQFDAVERERMVAKR